MGILSVALLLPAHTSWGAPGAPAADIAGARTVPRIDWGRDAERLVRILRPEPGEALFHVSRTIKVKVNPRASLSVRLNGRDVTRQLHVLGRGRIRRGVFPEGLLSAQPRTLAVTARVGRRTDTDYGVVRAVRETRGFLSVRLRRSPDVAAPVRATVRTRSHRMRLHMSLNGQRVDPSASPVRWRTRRLTLTAVDGLRHGRNVLRVFGHDEAGRGEVERRIFMVERRGAIPGVRAQDNPWVRQPLRLDARDSRPSGRHRRLSFRWRLVRRPAGSQAQLEATSLPVARFRPDRAGRYVARVRVTERHRSLRGRSGRTTLDDPGVTTALDVPLSAQPPISPYGIPFSVDAKAGNLDVGDQHVGGLNPYQGFMHAQVIDRRDGSFGSAQDFNASGNAYDLQSLTTFLNGLSGPDIGDMLVVLMGPGGSANAAYQPSNANKSRITALTQALMRLGLSEPDASDAVVQLAAGTPFAIAGIPGGESGSAVHNLVRNSKGAGQIQGFLRATTTGDGTMLLEQPDFRRFEFNDPGDPLTGPLSVTATGVNPEPDDPATISLGSLGGPPDMLVSVLDAVTLDPVTSAAVESDNATTNINALHPIAQVLNTYRNDPSVLILFMMKSSPTADFPFPAVKAWEPTRVDLSAISQYLASIGSNRDVFIRSLAFSTEPYNFVSQSGTGHNYIFLGGADMQPVEGTSVVTVPAEGMTGAAAVSSTNLTGLLQRDEQGRWVPTRGSPGDTLSHDLESLANRPPTSYSYPTSPPDGGGQYAAAEQYLYQKLINADSLCTPGPQNECSTVPGGVRVNYSQIGFLEKLAAGGTQSDSPKIALDCADPSSGVPPGPAFTKDQLTALTTQICQEFDQLETIGENLFVPLDGVYAQVQENSVLNLLANSSSFLGFLWDKRAEELSQKSKFLGISGEAADVLGTMIDDAVKFTAAALAPETGGGSEVGGGAVTDLLSLGSGVLGLSSEAVDAEDFDPATAKLDITVGTLFNEVRTAYGLAVDRNHWLWRLVASDPAKLAETYAKVSSSPQAWNLTNSILDGTKQAKDVVAFQYELAASRYQAARMVGSVVSTCDTGASSTDPMAYVDAFTQLKEYNQISNPDSNFLTNGQHNLHSAKLTSSDAQTFAPHVFGSPFVPGTDPIGLGPQGAWVAKSPFLMVQIPASQQVYKEGDKNDCSELMHP